VAAAVFTAGSNKRQLQTPFLPPTHGYKCLATLSSPPFPPSSSFFLHFTSATLKLLYQHFSSTRLLKTLIAIGVTHSFYDYESQIINVLILILSLLNLHSSVNKLPTLCPPATRCRHRHQRRAIQRHFLSSQLS
jgi:hypothetical protein